MFLIIMVQASSWKQSWRSLLQVILLESYSLNLNKKRSVLRTKRIYHQMLIHHLLQEMPSLETIQLTKILSAYLFLEIFKRTIQLKNGATTFKIKSSKVPSKKLKSKKRTFLKKEVRLKVLRTFQQIISMQKNYTKLFTELEMIRFWKIKKKSKENSVKL